MYIYRIKKNCQIGKKVLSKSDACSEYMYKIYLIV